MQSNLYPTEGRFTITVTITDKDGDSSSGSFAVMIFDTLHAESLVPTPSGVNITFNRAIELASLNLFGGTSDATLVGPNGLVAGSLLVNPGDSAISFVATGGILPAGSYTLKLRSAADAFQDTQGNLLDGDADGAAGDDLTFTFTVNPISGAPVVSLPDFARAANQNVSIPTNAVGLPVRVSNAAGRTTLSFEIAFDPTMLMIDGASPGVGVLPD